MKAGIIMVLFLFSSFFLLHNAVSHAQINQERINLQSQFKFPRSELRAVLSTIERQMKENKWKAGCALWSHYDLTTITEAIKALADGTLTADEASALGISNEEFTRLDTNRDGVVSDLEITKAYYVDRLDSLVCHVTQAGEHISRE